MSLSLLLQLSPECLVHLGWLVRWETRIMTWEIYFLKWIFDYFSFLKVVFILPSKTLPLSKAKLATAQQRVTMIWQCHGINELREWLESQESVMIGIWMNGWREGDSYIERPIRLILEIRVICCWKTLPLSAAWYVSEFLSVIFMYNVWTTWFNKWR